MGLFGKKKEKKQPAVISISGDQLCTMLKNSIPEVEDEINHNSFLFGPEIMFDYKDKTHFAGIKYDKKMAKRENQTVFSPKFMSFFLDKITYVSVDELYAAASVEGDKISAIDDGIIIFEDMKDLLEK